MTTIPDDERDYLLDLAAHRPDPDGKYMANCVDRDLNTQHPKRRAMIGRAWHRICLLRDAELTQYLAKLRETITQTV